MVIVTGLNVDMFLGMDFLSDHECFLDLGRKLVHFHLVGHSFALAPILLHRTPMLAQVFWCLLEPPLVSCF